MTTHPVMLVSATRARTEALLRHGPRRDFIALAEATGADVRYQMIGARRAGLAAKMMGAHVRQAWRLAREVEPGAIVFADGEHNGIPFALMSGLLRRRPRRLVMLGHLLSRRWKLPLLWLATRAGPRGVLVLHSVEQRRIVKRWVGRRWRIVLVPYQVDTEFWAADGASASADLPLVLAVGSENRDYATLVRAVEGLPVRVVIAAGSHWAREAAVAGETPPNVEYLSQPLGFAALRDLYRQAACVVVPLHDVANQSGVTTILEAMSCGRPVVVTASRGQQECIEGPLVTADGRLDAVTTTGRGPAAFGGPAGGAATGLYVPPADEAALNAAIRRVLEHPGEASEMGAAARRAAVEHFSLERFVATLTALLAPAPAESGTARRRVAA